MSPCELDAATVEQLRPLSESDLFGVVLGAGASAASGLPGWDTLVARLLVDSGTVPDEAVARALLDVQDPELAAEAARSKTGEANWPDLVRSALYGSPPLPAVPSSLHRAVAGLAAQRDPGAVGLFTLNFDVLLEEALHLAMADLGKATGIFTRTRANARARPGHYEVHHLHGVVGPAPGGSFDEVVLTLSDFNRLGASNHPWQVGALQDHLQRGPLLLAGTSYRDPDVRQWLYELDREPGTPPRVLLQARQSLRVDRARFAALRPQLLTQWQRAGVDAVLVGDYADAAQAVRELAALDQPDYRPPAQRARSLLDEHLAPDRFTALQADHAHLLDDDLDELRPHLGEEADLTLWLADGEGEMVRWACHDRTHRSPGHLRSVPTGHDSPWVAGQCLGQDETVIVRRDLPEHPDTRRWRSVVAAPVVVEIPGGPALATAAISATTPRRLEDDDADAWEHAMAVIASRWGQRLMPPTG